jgi:hypothetical protein
MRSVRASATKEFLIRRARLPRSLRQGEVGHPFAVVATVHAGRAEAFSRQQRLGDVHRNILHMRQVDLHHESARPVQSVAKSSQSVTKIAFGGAVGRDDRLREGVGRNPGMVVRIANERFGGYR